MNGGAGRVVASIPAFEKLYKEDKDFIIEVPDVDISVKLGSHVIQFSNISKT
mgnify:CR=1 FL=1